MKDKICDFISDFLESEKYRLPNFVPVGIGIGVGLYFSLDNEPIFIVNACAFILVVLLTACVKCHKWFLYILLTISAGFFVAQLRTTMVNTFMLKDKVDRPVSISAIVETCEKTEKGMVFIVKDVHQFARRKLPFVKRLNKLHLTWRGRKALGSKMDYRPGDKVSFRVILSPIAPQAFVGAYDFKKQQYFRNVSARGFIIKQPKIIERSKMSNLGIFVETLRHNINKQIETCLTGSIAAISEALTTGNKAGIPQRVRDSFARSGTAHILAISGLHMGIIGLFVFWLSRILLCCAIGKFCNVKKIAAVLSWIVVVFYLFISGCSVPSVRAFIMHTLVIGAILLDRTALTMRSVAIAAAIIIICTPEVILFPSFQMSFGAVIALIAFYEHAWNFSPVLKMIANVIATTVIASIPTTLFSMYAFNQLTLNSILANIVAVPLMTFFIMPVAVVAMFFMLFGLAKPFILLLGYGVYVLERIAYYASQLPGSFFVMHTPSIAVMLIMTFSGLVLALIHHRVRCAGLAGVCIGTILYAVEPKPDIFISQNTKAVGIRTEDGVFFNHLGYFRSITTAWTKSVGFEKKQKFNSKVGRKYVEQVDKNTFEARVKNTDVIITDDVDIQPNGRLLITLNAPRKFAESIYLPSKKTISNKNLCRPWS